MEQSAQVNIHKADTDNLPVKSSLDELGIFGALPLFRELLHVGRPNVCDHEKLLKRMSDVLESRWLTNNGPQVQEFERRIANAAGAQHCVAMCNATTALQIAARVANLSGEVIVPSFTFVATAHALQWLGITPVFCDIDNTYCLDPNRVEELITPRTTGIIGVHLWGHVCNVEALEAICRRHNLTLLFDAAHAFGCSRNGVMVGRFGRAEVLSFHATKFLNTSEGGAVVTDDSEFADSCRAMRNFGFSGEDKVSSLGINGKMNELEAVMGLTLLDHSKEIIANNWNNYLEYKIGILDIPGVTLIEYDEKEQCNFQYIVVEIGEDAGISRDLLHDLFHAEGILVRRYFSPGCHRMEPYLSLFPGTEHRLPRTENACARILCLPTGTAIGREQIRTVCALLRFAVENGAEIQARWKRQLRSVAESGSAK
jgi:dTDP-4-amino-4,6-dideoxygalactose transaminase